MSNILLCVDDSVTIQTIAEITFRKSDWEYVGARNADEARSAAGKSPSIILVDAVMPDVSGYDLAKELKAANADALIVMMCGNSEAYDEGKGKAAGCAGHIVKPWQTDKVVEQLAEMVGSDSAVPIEVAVASSTPMAKPKPKSVEPPRSATLMGMPALEMPPSKPLPAGVAAIKPAVKIARKPGIVKTPPPPLPVAAKAVPTPKPAPLAPPLTPAPEPVAVKPVAAPEPVAVEPVAAVEPTDVRKSMIAATPGKPIRLVLASQAEAAAKSTAEGGGMTSEQASALGDMSREMLERIIWDVVPELAESIIRENLETLTGTSPQKT